MPPVPLRFARKLHLVDDTRQGDPPCARSWCASTPGAPRNPSALDACVDAASADRTEYALVAYTGETFPALHFYLVQSPVLLFVQARWTATDASDDIARGRFQSMMGIAEQFGRLVFLGLDGGWIRRDDTLLVVASSEFGSYWSGPGCAGSHSPLAPLACSPTMALVEAMTWLACGEIA